MTIPFYDKSFSDKTELNITYDTAKISQGTGMSADEVNFRIETTK
jgi:hypothetical protein